MNVGRRWKIWGVLILLPSIILIAIFVYYFIGSTFFASLTDWGREAGLKLNPVKNFIGLDNYKTLFTEGIHNRFRQDMVNAVFYTLFLVSGAIIMGLALAILLDYSPKGESFYRTLFLYPMSLSFIVSGTIWRWLLSPRGGVNLFPRLLGLPKSEFLWLSSNERILNFNWQNLPVIIAIPLLIALGIMLFRAIKLKHKKKIILSSTGVFVILLYILVIHNFVKIIAMPETHGFQLATIGVLLAAIWQYSGYTMAIFLAGLRGIPESVYEAAKMDGASDVRYYAQIAIPLMKPITLSAVIILSHISLKMFALIFVMAGSDNINTGHPSILMFLTTFRANNFSLGATIAVVLFLLVAVFIIPYLISSYKQRSSS